MTAAGTINNGQGHSFPMGACLKHSYGMWIINQGFLGKYLRLLPLTDVPTKQQSIVAIFFRA